MNSLIQSKKQLEKLAALREEQAKKDFEAILESFATYAQGKPDLTVITPKSKPVVTD